MTRERKPRSVSVTDVPDPTEAEFRRERFSIVRSFVNRLSRLRAPPDELLSGCEDPALLPVFREECHRAMQKLAALASAIG